jgi:hypothetical protein
MSVTQIAPKAFGSISSKYLIDDGRLLGNPFAKSLWRRGSQAANSRFSVLYAGEKPSAVAEGELVRRILIEWGRG